MAGTNDNMSLLRAMHRCSVSRSTQGNQQAQGQNRTHCFCSVIFGPHGDDPPSLPQDNCVRRKLVPLRALCRAACGGADAPCRDPIRATRIIRPPGKCNDTVLVASAALCGHDRHRQDSSILAQLRAMFRGQRGGYNRDVQPAYWRNGNNVPLHEMRVRDLGRSPQPEP